MKTPRSRVLLRSRVTFTTQPIAADVTVGCQVARLSGREQTFAIDTDTWFRFAGRDVFGSLTVSRTKTTGALDDDRDERALTYKQLFTAFSFDKAKILIRPTLAVGVISHRGGSGVNLVNPAIEILRPFVHTGTNLHVIWSPQWVANGNDWKVTHQVAVLVDYPLGVMVF